MISGSDVLSRKTEQELRSCGIDCNIIDRWPDRWARRLWHSRIPFRQRIFKYTIGMSGCRKFIRRLEPGDVAWILESMLPFDLNCSFEKAVLQKGCGYIFHTKDDYITLSDSVLANQQKIRVSLADLIMVPTPNLRDRLLEYFPDKAVDVFEEPVDTERFITFNADSTDYNERPIVVWAGSPNSLKYLPHITKALKKVYLEKPFVFRVISGNIKPKIEFDFPWQWLPYDFEKEEQLLKGARIGLAALEDTPSTRCKGTYKVKVYMAAGIPVLASPIGYHQELVRHGKTGYMVDGEQEWVETLLMLLKNVELASEMGVAARAEAVQRFSHKQLMPVWAESLRRHFPHL